MDTGMVINRLATVILRDRGAKHLGQREYAELMGSTVATVQRIEYRLGLPNLSTFAALCAFTGWSPNDLLGWDEETKSFKPSPHPGR